MKTSAPAVPKSNYDSRWFIWTVVFLVIMGISLVCYIVFSDNTATDVSAMTVPRALTASKAK